MQNYPTRHSGMTLIELLVVLAIIGTLFSLGVPAWGRLTADARMTDAAATYHQAFNIARLIAVQRRRTVTVCPLGTDLRCTRNWSAGVDVFFDDDRNGALELEIDHLARFDGDDVAGVEVQWKGFGRRDRLSVNENGNYRQNGRFRFCAPGQTRGRSLVINAAGRVRVEPLNCPA